MSGKTNLAIFDLDGTLFDTRRVNYLSYREALLPFGVDLDFDYFARECNGKHYKTFIPVLLRSAGNDDSEISEMTEKVHEKKKNCYPKFLHETNPNAHLFSVIRLIRHEYSIALVTTASRKNCMEILGFHKNAELFDLILTAENVKNKKPDPEGFLKAMEHFCASAENTMIFEDSAEGLLAAERTGATTFAVRGFA